MVPRLPIGLILIDLRKYYLLIIRRTNSFFLILVEQTLYLLKKRINTNSLNEGQSTSTHKSKVN